MAKSSAGKDTGSEINHRKRKDGSVIEKKGKKKQRLEEASEGSIYDSDDIDNELVVEAMKARQSKARQARKSQPQPKRRKVSNELGEIELEEGQELVGIVVQAPKTGLVPAGQLSENTLNFLRKLDNLECNNRKWFKLHEAIYRAAEREWQSFVEAFTDLLTEVDPQIPHLPPKDVIHRIYRDIRFSSDKTPYKRNLSASFSRSGRKGIFAGYHISIKPGDDSFIAAGSWCPHRNELATIRFNIQRNSQRLRDVISSPAFVKFFGEPKPHPNGKRQNIFGSDDELKTAPKGVPKDHSDIDLLRCRSFAVVYRFPDCKVLSPDFKTELADVARVLRPFVHCLNNLLTIQERDDSEDENEDENEDEAHTGDE